MGALLHARKRKRQVKKVKTVNFDIIKVSAIAVFLCGAWRFLCKDCEKESFLRGKLRKMTKFGFQMEKIQKDD